MDIVLAIGAHPMDIELGCSGTLALHKAKRHEVYLLVLSLKDAKKERLQCRQSAETLNVDGLFFGEVEDVVPSDPILIQRVIEEVKPSVIYTHSLKDSHQDHRKAGLATLSAGIRCRMMLMYELPFTSRRFNPQAFVDIQKTLGLKRELVNVFKSRLEGVSGGADVVEILARRRGFQAGMEVAEAYELERFILKI